MDIRFLNGALQLPERSTSHLADLVLVDDTFTRILHLPFVLLQLEGAGLLLRLDW